MRYWVSLVNTEEVDQFVELARHAERLGFEGISVPDHLSYPMQIDTPYPYTPDGKVWWPHSNPWPDPWVTLTAMGVATERLRLATNIYLAGLRDPFTVARATAACAIFTGNRAVCGVSAGWIKEEFDVMGIDFAARGRRLDEVIHCMKQLHRGEPVSHSGEFFQFPEIIHAPAPTVPVPVWVGGVSKAALKRAAANDGWMSVPAPNAKLIELIEVLQTMREHNGRAGQPFDILLSPMEMMTKEFIKALPRGIRYHTSVLPWTPSPWGRAPWVKPDEDHRELSVKLRAMERFKAAMLQTGIW